MDAKLGQVASEVQTMQKVLEDSRDAALEQQDKEARRNNIILYRVPESDAPLALWQPKDFWQTRDFVNSSCLG